MGWRDQITLIALSEPSERTNEHGFPTRKPETATTVFADKKSVGYSEFYKAEMAGHAAEIKFDVYAMEYNGQTEAQTDFDTWFEGLQEVLDDDAAGNLLNMITALTARVDLIEAVIFNDITDNPFLILFDDLTGVTTTGVWNESLQRIEC